MSASTKRNGTANLFIFLDVHRPWRKVKVTEHRTAEDFAICMRELSDVHFPRQIRSGSYSRLARCRASPPSGPYCSPGRADGAAPGPSSAPVSYKRWLGAAAVAGHQCRNELVGVNR